MTRLFWLDSEEMQVVPSRTLRPMVRKDVPKKPLSQSPEAIYMRAYRKQLADRLSGKASGS